MSYNKRKDELWQKAKKIRGKNPDLYRRDELGNTLYYHSYGKNTEMGWQIDHRKPQSKNGTNHLNNLRVLQKRANLKKSNKY